MADDQPTDDDPISASLRAVADLAEPLERSATLERVGRVAAESIGAELGFIGLLDGPDHMQLSAVHGGTTGALEQLRVERGRGLGGKVLADGQPTSVLDYRQSKSITHEYDAEISREGLSGMLCIPLIVGDDVAGVAYVADRIPKQYSDVMVDRVLTAVESAKIALSMADRSRALTEAAVEAERERTAKALGDSVGQDLGAILSIAEAIAADPNSSASLVAQAAAIADSAGHASHALHTSFETPSGRLEAVHTAAVNPLSARELQVVQLAARGMSNPEIAAELFLARGTVKAYMETALRKLDARNRVEAVMIAARSGFLDVEF